MRKDPRQLASHPMKMQGWRRSWRSRLPVLLLAYACMMPSSCTSSLHAVLPNYVGAQQSAAAAAGQQCSALPVPLQLRGGEEDGMQDGEMGAWEAWEMLTAIDDFGDNVTMLQLRDPPYTVVELWWESEGKLRFSYDDVGDDVMCVWAHGGTSNNSAWELEGLRQQLSQQRGLCPQPALPLQLGPWWTLESSGSHVRVRNAAQPQAMLCLTRRGFVFFDKIGQAIRVENGRPPERMAAKQAAAIVGIDPAATCPPPSTAHCLDWPPTSKKPFLGARIRTAAACVSVFLEVSYPFVLCTFCVCRSNMSMQINSWTTSKPSSAPSRRPSTCLHEICARPRRHQVQWEAAVMAGMSRGGSMDG